MDDLVLAEIERLGQPGQGALASLDYLRRMYEGGLRILHADLPSMTWGERLRRWVI